MTKGVRVDNGSHRFGTVAHPDRNPFRAMGEG
jgi:hypothetical protein